MIFVFANLGSVTFGTPPKTTEVIINTASLAAILSTTNNNATYTLARLKTIYRTH